MILASFWPLPAGELMDFRQCLEAIGCESQRHSETWQRATASLLFFAKSYCFETLSLCFATSLCTSLHVSHEWHGVSLAVGAGYGLHACML